MLYTFPGNLVEIGNSYFVLIPMKIAREMKNKRMTISIDEAYECSEGVKDSIKRIRKAKEVSK